MRILCIKQYVIITLRTYIKLYVSLFAFHNAPHYRLGPIIWHYLQTVQRSRRSTQPEGEKRLTRYGNIISLQ